MIGTTISHYKILEKIGEGGMGLVYKAEDTNLKRTVALKFLPQEFTRDKEARDRFIQEAQAAAALNHPNICVIHEIDVADGHHFIVMEYIDGISLKEKISSGPLEIDEVFDIGGQVAEGLCDAHQNGIIHRDIKPANIMVTQKGQVKIMDFGLAKLEWGVDLTKTATIMGTVAYMSPEQAQGEKVDFRADIWALGAVFYEMLTGERPFKSVHEQAMIYAILNEDPKSLFSFRKDLPNKIEKTVMKALSKNPADRHQSIREFWLNLDRASVEIAPPETEKKSIAVLPFENMSADPEQEFFCDGITEEIINALAHLENLRVIARTSAFVFKGKHEDIRDIGRKLDVGTLLEGSVRKSGDRLRITAQLINASDGSHIWSERFDRQVADVFDIQDEISLQIVDKLRIKLGRDEKDMMVKRYTEDIEAYNLYLKGFYHFAKITREGCEKGLALFHEVIKKDTSYALAYTGIADCHLRNTWYYFQPPKQELPKALSFAKKALALDDQLSEAHASLGFTKMLYERDWDGAGRELKIAINLNPGNAQARNYYSVYCAVLGKKDISIEEAQKALDLDPVSLSMMLNLAMRYYYACQFEKSLEQIQRAIDLDPTSYAPYCYSSFPLVCLGRYQEAIQTAQKAEKILGGHTPHTLAALGLSYSFAGERSKAEQVIKDLIELSEEGTIPLFIIPWIYLGLEDRKKAFEWIDRANEEKDPLLMWIKSDPIINRLGPDPRYHAMLKELGLDRFEEKD